MRQRVVLTVLLAALATAGARQVQAQWGPRPVHPVAPGWGGGYWHRPYTPNAVRYGQSVQWPSESSSSSQPKPQPTPVPAVPPPPPEPSVRYSQPREEPVRAEPAPRPTPTRVKDWESWDQWLEKGTGRMEYGSTVKSLPEDRQEVDVDGHTFYLYNHLFFDRQFVGGRVAYTAVKPPIGAVVTDLPGGCGKMGVRGTTYRVCGDTWYMDWDGQYVVTDGPQ